MREMDFSEKNLRNRWLGVNSVYYPLHDEVKRFVKRRLERAMDAEVTARVGCRRYERSDGRCGYRNGVYARNLLTTYGWIDGLKVPRLREGSYDSQVFERYRRRQRAVDRVLLEAFLLGHATRKVRRLIKSLFGAEISPQAVSNVVHELDEEVSAFHLRRFERDYQVVYLDGLWVTLRSPVKMKKVLLVALGMKPDGSKELLGFHLATNESEACWYGFISDLKHRGLAGMEVIVSDGAAGLVKSIRALYPRADHQLCTYHKAVDLADHLLEKRHRRQIIGDANYVFAAAHETEARKRLHLFKAKWRDKEPKAVRNFFRGIDACFVYLGYPEPLRTSLKTNNPIERYIEEIRRRTIPMRSFNNAGSAERIIYGVITYVLNNPMDMPNTEFTQYA
ncbi:MAG: IS256 family transposase [candidate division Zixibacteria bacterium]|nr:IS256 family transposase [candidate division Zixibacteria bacterium]